MSGDWFYDWIFKVIIILDCEKTKNPPFQLKSKEIYEAILNLSSVYNIDNPLAFEASELHAEIKTKHKHFSVADIFVLLTARRLKAKVVTGARILEA